MDARPDPRYTVAMSEDQNPDRGATDGLVVTRTRPKAKRPPLYKVLLLNDDFTPMDFVITVLKKFFAKNDAQATEIMLQVHSAGAGLAGIYTFEVAETKAHAVTEFSRRHSHPLKCTMESE